MHFESSTVWRSVASGSVMHRDYNMFFKYMCVCAPEN